MASAYIEIDTAIRNIADEHYGFGYRNGAAAERRAIVAMLRDRDGAYFSRDTAAAADAIEAGEHHG